MGVAPLTVGFIFTTEREVSCNKAHEKARNQVEF
jgi:hypothetical protein